MKKAYVYVLALALIFAAAAVPSMANGVAEGRGFSVTVEGFPELVARGDDVTGTITISMFPSVPIRRQDLTYQVFITTPFGDAPVMSGSFLVRPGVTRSVKIDVPVETTAEPGNYSMKIVFTSGGESLSVGHDLTVR
jgi:hypothetical protein